MKTIEEQIEALKLNEVLELPCNELFIKGIGVIKKEDMCRDIVQCKRGGHPGGCSVCMDPKWCEKNYHKHLKKFYKGKVLRKLP